MLLDLTMDWMMSQRIRSYSELIRFKTYEDRLKYLQLNGVVGETTFGHDRYLNQKFYKSKEWLQVKDKVIIRDDGCDMGLEGYDIYDRILIHHMNPMMVDDIIHFNDDILNPEYLVCVSLSTHNAIHYGFEPKSSIVRKPGDTKLW